MLKQFSRLYLIALSFVGAILLFLFWIQIARAGSGTPLNIPASTTTPVMDGVCNSSEYKDAVVMTVTVGTDHPFPVYMQHTNTDAYFCFGGPSGLPLPPAPLTNTLESVAVYIDPDNNVNTLTDDFGIWVPYDTQTPPFAGTWLTDTRTYGGPLPSTLWKAVRSPANDPNWSAEFKISSQALGGMNHTVGLALFYHWWQRESDDYSWPENGIWAYPSRWANAGFSIKLIYLPMISRGP